MTMMGGSLGDATLGLRASLKELNKNLKTAQGKMKGAVGKMQGLANGLKLGAAGAGVAIAGIGVKAVASAAEFEKGMREVNTLVGGDESAFKQLQSDTLAFSKEMGLATDKAVPGLYQAISSGVPPENVFQFMEESARAAIGGSAELSDVIGVTTAILKGYGEEMTEAAKVQDLLQKTVQLGVTTMPELAANMGKVTPLAAALGVPIEELTGAMATLTGVTGNTAEVSTQLRATYQAFVKPTKEMGEALNAVAKDLKAQGKLTSGPLVDAWEDLDKQLKDSGKRYQALQKEQDELDTSTKEGKARYRELGQEIKNMAPGLKDLEEQFIKASAALGPSIVQTLGFQDALAMVAGTAEGDTAALGKMLGSVEAISAALALTGPQAETYTEKVEAMAEAGGAAQAAFDEMEKSTSRLWAKFKTTLSVELIKLGQKLLPIVTKVLTKDVMPAFERLTKWFSENEGNIKGWFKKVWAIASPILDGFKTGFKLIVDFLVNNKPVLFAIIAALGALIITSLGPVSLAMLAIFGLISAVGLLKKHWGTIVAFFKGLLDKVVGFFKTNWDKILAIIFPIPGIAILVVRNWGKIVGIVKGLLLKVVGLFRNNWKLILGVIFPVFGLAQLIIKHWGKIKEKVSEILGAVFGFFGDLWSDITGWFTSNPLTNLISDSWGKITEAVGGIFEDVWKTVGGWLDDIVGLADTAVSKIIGFFNGIGEGIAGAFRSGLNAVIKALNKALGVAAELVIKIKGALDKIPGPNPAGNFLLDVSAKLREGIPTLALGGIVDQPTLAMLGESGPEAVIPLPNAGMVGKGTTIIVEGPIYGFDDFAAKVQEAMLLGARRGRQDLLR